MFYAASMLGKQRDEELYRVYMTDSIQLLAQGMYMPTRYADVKSPPPDFDVDEVIEQVAARGGMEVI